MKLIFLLEEPSMEYLLEELLPKILPKHIGYDLISHNGKSALRKSLPSKLRGWTEPNVRFVVVHDQDRKNCVELKQELINLCSIAGRDVLIRIVCQELEAWYFGDMKALAKAYNRKNLGKLSQKETYRIPDSIPRPKEQLLRLIPNHEQINGAKLIGSFMDIDNNTSESFRCFVSGICRLAEEASTG